MKFHIGRVQFYLSKSSFPLEKNPHARVMAQLVRCLPCNIHKFDPQHLCEIKSLLWSWVPVVPVLEMQKWACWGSPASQAS